MKYLTILSVVFILFSCESTKERMTLDIPDFIGRWTHTPLANEDGTEYNLAVFADSTYYLTCSSPFLHLSGNIIVKQDTLVFYKDDISSRNFSFIFKLEEDILKLSSMENKIGQNNIELTGLWKRE